jgi:hypothetical protein
MKNDTADPTEFLSAASVRHRYDAISDMTLWRWLQDPKSGFPKPLYIGRFRYWRLAELQAFERGRSCEGRAA